jgi:DNA recombination protein RmuC
MANEDAYRVSNELLIGLWITLLASLIFLLVKIWQMQRAFSRLQINLTQGAEEKHRAILQDLYQGLSQQGEVYHQGLANFGTSLHQFELTQTQALANHSHAIQQKLDGLREEVLNRLMHTLAEQSRAEMELLQSTLRQHTEQLTKIVLDLSDRVDLRLQEISGKVTERLDEGFKKTNETFTNVMIRLATIDEAQKKIDSLTTNVVSLQELLGDKRARGAFGEVQLEALVRNLLPVQSFEFQVMLSNGTRVDCLLSLPDPTGKVAIDSKFPLENYHRMFATQIELERKEAQRAFKLDVRKHIDAIATKYILTNETSDGAVMFLPAEAVFAEIHAYHADLVQYAQGRRVWIVSPTTMMAVLNTARAVMKDVETRKQVHIIQEALGRLSKEFERFDIRMKKLADHIRQAHEDAQQVQITSDKISRRFVEIEGVSLLEDNHEE